MPVSPLWRQSPDPGELYSYKLAIFAYDTINRKVPANLHSASKQNVRIFFFIWNTVSSFLYYKLTCLAKIPQIHSTDASCGPDPVVFWPKSGLEEVGESLSKANPIYIAISVLIICLGYFLRAIRWQGAARADH